MDGKGDSGRQENCQESVGGVWGGGWGECCVCRSLLHTQGGGLSRVNFQRSRKEPEQPLLQPFLKTYCVLCPGLRAGPGESSLCPKGGRADSQGPRLPVGAVSCGGDVSIRVWGAGEREAMCWGRGGGSGGSQPRRGWDTCLTGAEKT